MRPSNPESLSNKELLSLEETYHTYLRAYELGISVDNLMFWADSLLQVTQEAETFTDFFQEKAIPKGRKWTSFMEELRQRGVNPQEVEKLSRGNFLKVFVALGIGQDLPEIRKKVTHLRRRYQSLKRHISEDPCLSPDLKVRAKEEIEIALKFLQAMNDSQYRAWRRKLGVDKDPERLLSQQAFWKLIIKELVDYLKPYCHTRIEGKGVIPGEVFRFVAKILHLRYPKIWPDRPTLIKQRYYSSL